MIIVKVWLLSKDTPEERLREIHLALVRAAIFIFPSEVKDETDMMVLFPHDLMRYGVGKEIYIEVSLHFDTAGKRLTAEEIKLQNEAGCGEFNHALVRLYPKARLVCTIEMLGARGTTESRPVLWNT